MSLTKNRFWHLRSWWDSLAFIPLLQWASLAVFFVGWGLAVVGASGMEPIVLGSLGGVVLINWVSWIAVFGVWRGSESHDHMDPSGWYVLAAFLFAPIIGPHYLYRTGRADA